MDSQQSRQSIGPLDYRVGEDADVAQIAETIGAIWIEIDVALSPIVGPRGVAALYRRSLYLGRAAHPWMTVLHEGLEQPLDTRALQSLLECQNRADALAAGKALFQTFHDLLGSLVGPSLTEKLLRPVWAHSPGPAPETEPSP